MVSAFAPRLIIGLKDRDKSKIESVLSYGDRILVGLSTGSLRVYRVVEPPSEDGEDAKESPSGNADSSAKPSVELLREVEKFSRRKIEQLSIIKEASILVSLSDQHVSFYDLESYTLSERLENTKGATCFATARNINKDAESGLHSIISRLAVAVKRKILIWTWENFELIDTPEELTLPTTVKSLTWVNSTRIVAGMDPGFSMVDLEAQTVSDINRPIVNPEANGPTVARFGAVTTSGMGYVGMGNWIPKPLATRLSDNEILLAKDVNSLFIDFQGNALEKRQIPWSSAPDAIGYSYPYLLVLQPSTKGVLELRNPESLTLLQSIPVENASILHVPQPNISLAHAGKGFLVANDRSVWRMEAIGYGSQIDELLGAGHFDEALIFSGLIEDTLLLDKAVRIRQIKIAKAKSLFEHKEYREALDLFAEAPARPAQVISLYPENIAGNLSRNKSKDANEHAADKSEETENSKDTTKVESSQTPTKSKYWPSIRGKASDQRSIRSSIDEPHEDDTAERAPKPLEGNDLKMALSELRLYLAEMRRQIQKYLDFDGNLKQSLAEMKAESNNPDQPQDPPFARFIYYNISDDEETVKNKLFEVATLVDTTLFRVYIIVSLTQAGSLFRIDNFCATDIVQQKLTEKRLYSELLDFLWGKKKYEEALKLLQKLGQDEDSDEDLRGPAKTVQYLQRLPFELIDLTLRFAWWPLEVNPSLGLEVFVANTAHAESLQRDRVVKYLETFDSSLVTQYLEHVILDWGDSNHDFHNQLATLYVQFLEKDSESNWQEKLESFLRKSHYFNKDAILKRMPTNNPKFFESRVIVLNKLGFHREALKIYVYQVQDPRKAEEYCNQTYLSLTSSHLSTIDPDEDGKGPQAIYTTLLSLYLTPPAPYEQNLDAALDLLSLHGSRLPALNTIATIPKSLPIQDLESYFRARMRAANSLAREAAILKALSSVEKSDCEKELLLGDGLDRHIAKTSIYAGRNRRVVLGENRLCPVCNKRFGRAAARVFPDGEVLHYGCSNRRMKELR